jgi:hypothetical protein
MSVANGHANAIATGLAGQSVRVGRESGRSNTRGVADEDRLWCNLVQLCVARFAGCLEIGERGAPVAEVRLCGSRVALVAVKDLEIAAQAGKLDVIVHGH